MGGDDLRIQRSGLNGLDVTSEIQRPGVFNHRGLYELPGTWKAQAFHLKFCSACPNFSSEQNPRFVNHHPCQVEKCSDRRIRLDLK